MRSFLNKAVLGAVALAAISGTAFAQSLAPGQTLTPVQLGTFNSAGLTLLAGNTATYLATSGPETISGTLASAVYGNGADLASSTTLSFVYQLANSGASTSAITDFRLNGFAFANITNSYEDNASGAFTAAGASFGVPSGPRNVQLSRFAATNGNAINYSYDPVAGSDFLGAGEVSNLLVFEIEAAGFDPNGNASVNGQDAVSANTTGTVFTPVPATVVPEANAGLLAGLALPLLGGIAVLRRKK